MEKYMFDNNSNFIIEKMQRIAKKHRVELKQKNQESNLPDYIQYFQVLNEQNFISYVVIIHVNDNIWLCKEIINSVKEMFAKYNFKYCENEFKFYETGDKYSLQFNSSDYFLTTEFYYLN